MNVRLRLSSLLVLAWYVTVFEMRNSFTNFEVCFSSLQNNWWGLPPDHMGGVHCLSSKEAHIVVDDVLAGSKIDTKSSDRDDVFTSHLERYKYKCIMIHSIGFSRPNI